MGATPDLHGLGWPEGNPDGLSASARRLAGLGGAILDYLNARAEGDSTGRAAREAGVVGVTTVVGSGVGGVACGAVGSVSLGAGYASCVVLVPAGGVIGKVAGDGINLLVDTVGL